MKKMRNRKEIEEEIKISACESWEYELLLDIRDLLKKIHKKMPGY